MNRSRLFVVAAVVGAVVVVVAVSSLAPKPASNRLHWSRDRALAHRASVEPGKLVELCGKLAPGDAIRWEFASSVPVDFNIHYHVGKEAEFLARQAQVSSWQDTLRVAVHEDYCWMWINKSASLARIDVRLQRQN